jgi:hypothetical protein
MIYEKLRRQSCHRSKGNILWAKDWERFGEEMPFRTNTMTSPHIQLKNF